MKGCIWGFAGAAISGALVKKVWLGKYQEQKEAFEKVSDERDLLYKWVGVEESGACVSDYFKVNGYDRVAVFGMNRMGRLLADTLGESAVYGVELENPSAVHERMTVYRLVDDPLPPADCIVICDMEQIPQKKKILQAEFKNPVLTLSEVLEWTQNQSM